MANRTAEARRKSLCSVLPGVAMTKDWAARLPEKTGRSLEEWIRLVQKSGPPTEKERREWLKARHNLGTNAAWWIAERAEGEGLEAGDPEAYLKAAEEYVEAMFAGGKVGLKPICERLLRTAFSLGKDVKACPCRRIVPLYRRHVFAQIKPTTRTRIDLGLALSKTKIPGRLLDTDGLAKGDRIAHRIPISALSDVDGEVKRWLKAAYDLDA